MGLMRRAILKASQSAWMRERAPRYAFFRRTTRRFMPGETVQDALTASRELAKKSIGSVLTHLGENIADRAEAEGVARHYLDVLDKIRAGNLPVEISVKLTQLGLDLDREFCFVNLAKLIEHCPPEKTLWIDMEQSPYVDATLELYRRARKAYKNVGLCVQAYLYRTERDLESLIPFGAAVRLVKGAYNEPPHVAIPKKRDMDENYFALAQELLRAKKEDRCARAAFATHDVALIRRIFEAASREGFSEKDLEVQMLYGIQRAEQERLAGEGCRTGVLVSYGSYWYPWFVRRLAERPANLWFLARNIFAG